MIGKILHLTWCRDQRQPLLIWSAATSVYVLAVFHRSSLGVAGTTAADRFDLTAAQLATFTVIQLCVYGGLQIPVGVLLDRFGAQRLLLTATAMTTVAQVVFAMTSQYPTALATRVFFGAGDALILISVLRIVAAWFPQRRSMLMNTLTTMAGGAGALIATVPLAWALRTLGWTTTFVAAASGGVVVALVVLALVRDAPPEQPHHHGSSNFRSTIRGLHGAWRNPGVKLGFWSHFSLLAPPNVFVLLWGYPYLTHVEQLSDNVAAAMLGLPVVVLVIGGPLLSNYVAGHQWSRSTVVLIMIAIIMLAWAAVLFWPGTAPPWLLVSLAAVIGLGIPGSMIGFDFARTHIPSTQLGRATGIVNFGGFVSSAVCVLAIGAVLDLLTPAAAMTGSPDAYRWAMSLQFIVWLLGGVQVWRYRTRARTHLFATQPELARSISGLSDYPPRSQPGRAG